MDAAPSQPARTGIAWTGSRIHVERIADGPRTREVVRHPGGAVILPLLPGDRVVLIRNRRPAVEAVLWELPAGTRDAGEDPVTVAARELAEETGYRAGRLEPFGSLLTTPGFTDERLWTFVARDLEPGPQRLDPGESIEVAPVPMAEALAMIDDGRIEDAKTIAVLLRWARRPAGADDAAGSGA